MKIVIQVMTVIKKMYETLSKCYTKHTLKYDAISCKIVYTCVMTHLKNTENQSDIVQKNISIFFINNSYFYT